MKRAWAILPIILLFGLAILGALKLASGNGDNFGKSDGRPAPTRTFERLNGGEPLQFSQSPDGQVRIVNLWASWCGPCRVEHPLLEELGRRHPDQLYGILYEDTVEKGNGFLARFGDPFTAVGLDPDGSGGLDFGLTGVPETFVVSPEGQIIRHIRGPLTDETLEEVSALVSNSQG